MAQVSNGDEELDPRIRIELEKLNCATDEINKLEKALDEANTTFRLHLSQKTVELDRLIRQLGSSVDKARPFYSAKAEAEELHKACLAAAVQYQRASDTYQAAKFTVQTTEQKYTKTETKEESLDFDAAWQEVLNHATMKVMEAEGQRTQNERKHRMLAERFSQAEKKVYELERLLQRDILRAKPYFDCKDDMNLYLENVKNRTNELKTSIANAKRAYTNALKSLENISEEIHRKRATEEFLTKRRTPGEGEEHRSEMSLSE